MRHLHAQSLAAGALLALSVRAAADAEYVTDTPAYSILAPCAASALSYAINAQTYSASCGVGQDELQSCICSNSGLRDDVTSSVSSDISTGCGGRSASEDQRSASQVFDQYCSPALTVDFPMPTKNIVNAYITDLAEMEWLAPCAYSGLSMAVMQESQSRCPEEASLFAPCVCSKNNVVNQVSTTISRTVRYSCSNDEDVTSAYNFFDEYCAMNKGTTSFAKPEGPEGDMTYHITALPQFKSLNTCAQSGVSSAILRQTAFYCAEGPQALASCVCIKSGMRSKASSVLTSDVKWNCDNTATAEVSSALGVLDFYCSAAEGDVVAEVTESVPQSYPAAESRTGSGGSSPSETGGANGFGGDQSGSQDGGDSSSGSRGNTNKTATVAASVLGGVIGLAIVVGIGLYIRRKKSKTKKQSSPVEPTQYLGHPELHGDDSRTDIIKTGSPAISEPFPDQPELGDHGIVEMAHQTPRPELQRHSNTDRYVPHHQAQELASSGSGDLASHLSQSPQQSQATVSPMSPGQHGMGWQAGPVESYEMNSRPQRD